MNRYPDFLTSAFCEVAQTEIGHCPLSDIKLIDRDKQWCTRQVKETIHPYNTNRNNGIDIKCRCPGGLGRPTVAKLANPIGTRLQREMPASTHQIMQTTTYNNLHAISAVETRIKKCGSNSKTIAIVWRCKYCLTRKF